MTSTFGASALCAWLGATCLMALASPCAVRAAGDGDTESVAESSPGEESKESRLGQPDLQPRARAAATTQTPTRRGALEEIVVTSRKREENLQRAPLAVTAFSAQDLRDRDVRRIDGIVAGVPNLHFDSTQGSSHASRIYLRGVGNGDSIASDDPGVGMYLDGVYMPRAQGGLLAVSDLERVEVLRGPQGTLFGKNTIGGAIDVITRKPALDEFSGNAEVRFGNFHRFDTRFSANLPLLDERAAARFSFATGTRDALMRNRGAGPDLQDDKLLAGRAQFLLSPSESLEIQLSADHSIENRMPQGGKCVVENTRTVPEDPATAFDDGVVRAPPSARIFGAVSGIPLDQQQAFFQGGGNGFFDHCRQDAVRGPRSVASDMRFARDYLKTFGTNGTIAWDVSDKLTLKSISAWRRNLTWNRVEADYTDLTLAQPTLGAGNQKQDAISQELQLSGTALDNRASFVFGLFGFVEKNHGLTPGGIANGGPLFFSANSRLRVDPKNPSNAPADTLRFRDAFASDPAVQAAFPNAQPFTLLVDPNGNPVVAPGAVGTPVAAVALPGASTAGLLEVNNLSYAAYSQGTYDLSDRLSLTLGVRLTHERKRVRNQIRAITPGVIGGNVRRAGEIDFEFEHSARFTNWSPMANLSYQWSDDLLVYANASRGFKSGGFNGRANDRALTDPIDDESVTAYETGLKSTWFNRRLLLDAAAFWSVYQDIQLTVPRGANSQAQILVLNAGEAVIQGAELEVRALLLPGLELSSTLGATDARYRDFADPTNRLAKNRQLPGVPNYTLNFAAAYEFPVSDFGALRLRGEWKHRGASGTDVVDTPLLRRGKNGELDAQLSFAFADGRTEIAFFGKNLLDRQFVTNGVSLGASFGHTYRFFNDPRTYGVEVRRQF